MNTISTWEMLEACYAQAKPYDEEDDDDYDRNDAEDYEDIVATMDKIMKLIDANSEFDTFNKFFKSKWDDDDLALPAGWNNYTIFDIALRNDHVEIALIFGEQHCGKSAFDCYEKCMEMENGAGVAMAEKIIQRMSYSDIPKDIRCYDDSLPFNVGIIYQIYRARKAASPICKKFFIECHETWTNLKLEGLLSTKDSLKKNIKISKHYSELRGEEFISGYPCEDCGREFTTRSSMQKHRKKCSAAAEKELDILKMKVSTLDALNKEKDVEIAKLKEFLIYACTPACLERRSKK